MTNDNHKPAKRSEAEAYDSVRDVIIGLQYLSMMAKGSDLPALSTILDKAIRSCLGKAKSTYGKPGRKFMAELADSLRDNEQFVDIVSRIKDPEKRQQLIRLVQAAARK
jgi:hypothetical protein